MASIFDVLISIFNAFKQKPGSAQEPVVTEVNNLDNEELPMEENKQIILKDYLLSDQFIVELKKQIFPFTPMQDIKDHWPLILHALEVKDLLDKEMVCYSLATLAVENDKFKPVLERPSKYSDTDGQAPYNFSKYDKMTGLGNTPQLDGDGELYRGSGFIQLTGKSNYKDMDKKLGLGGGLVEGGAEAANEPHIAAAIFAQYMKDREPRIRKAFSSNDLIALRKIVNGGTIGLAKFSDSYKKLLEIL
jgi:predicted chitinase